VAQDHGRNNRVKRITVMRGFNLLANIVLHLGRAYRQSVQNGQSNINTAAA
jgi:hypothetical protein